MLYRSLSATYPFLKTTPYSTRRIPCLGSETSSESQPPEPRHHHHYHQPSPESVTRFLTLCFHASAPRPDRPNTRVYGPRTRREAEGVKGLDTKLYDVVCVSPRNHMVFTPLLASTCVGTLEFRSVAESIARIQPAISREPGSYFFLSNCIGLDTDKHLVQCEIVTDGPDTLEPWKFEIAYDKLVIALGAEPTTFGIQGVVEHAVFLREVYNAQEIRRKLLLNLMLSDVPGVSEEEKSRLLHCVVVGGGSTGVEFSGELSDFIQKDVRQRYSHVKDYIHVTLIETIEIYPSCDDRRWHYAT